MSALSRVSCRFSARMASHGMAMAWGSQHPTLFFDNSSAIESVKTKIYQFGRWNDYSISWSIDNVLFFFKSIGMIYIPLVCCQHLTYTNGITRLFLLGLCFSLPEGGGHFLESTTSCVTATGFMVSLDEGTSPWPSVFFHKPKHRIPGTPRREVYPHRFTHLLQITLCFIK